MFTKKQKRANRALCISVICPVMVWKKPFRAINFTNSYTWRKTSDKHEYKEQVQKYTGLVTKTLKSEHVIVRQRKESLWIAECKNGAALPSFPSTVITKCDKFHNAVLMKWVEEHTHKKLQSISHKILIPVAARSKVWVCGLSLAGFAGSNPAWGTYVCLLWVLCVVRYRSLRRANHSSRELLPTVVCVWSQSLDREEDHEKKNKTSFNVRLFP